MSELKVASILDASGGNTAVINGFTPTESNMAGRNRIINGEMRIDQRNAGAAVSTNGAYPVDRFVAVNATDCTFTAEQVEDAPAGFYQSLKWTTNTPDASLAASQYTSIRTFIEGLNVADFKWGTASAKTVTLSFWVKSSLTGTFSGALGNSAYDRSYPFDYTVSFANTWEYKTVTIAGDTSGTWLATNGIGIRLYMSLGAGSDFNGTAGTWNSAGRTASSTGATSVVGTSGATFYLTGVQLEVGEVATPFERRSYGQELALCQRYYYRTADDGSTTNLMAVGVESSSSAAGGFPHPVSMRAAPTITLGSGIRFFSAATSTITPSISGNRSSTTTFAASFAISGATGGQAGSIFKGAANGFVEASSEL